MREWSSINIVIVKTDFPINIVTVLRSTVCIGTVKTDFPITIVILDGDRRDENR